MKKYRGKLNILIIVTITYHDVVGILKVKTNIRGSYFQDNLFITLTKRRIFIYKLHKQFC